MQNTKLEILLIGDNLPEAELIKEMLSEAPKPGFTVHHVQYLADGIRQLASRDFDCILIDLGLPDSQGLEIALAVRDNSKQTPIVVLTVLDDEETALKALQMDIQDYLFKEEISGRLLIRSIRYAIQRKRDVEALQESEERFRATFNQAAIGIGHVTPDGRWLRINQKYCDIVGYTEEELKSLTIRDLTHPDDLEESMLHYQLLLEGKLDNYSLEKRYIRKDGSTVWVHLAASMVFDTGGNPRFAVGVATDITKRKLVEEALKDSEEKLRFASTAADIGMWHWDLVNNSLTWSDRCKEFFGYPPDYPMTYEAFLQPIHEEDRQRVDQAVRKSLQEKTDYFAEMRVIMPDGQLRWVMSKGRGFFDDLGKPIRMHGIVMDITERKQADAEIRRLASFPLMNPNPILELDADGRMTFCNPAAKEIVENAGYTEGANPLIPRDLPELLQCLRDNKAGQLLRDVKINGRFFEELIYIAPPFNAVRIYTMDITERKRLGEEIERLNSNLAARAVELEAANRELEAFNYTVAHDLRRPLTVVNGYCQAIREICSDQLDEQCQGYLQEAYDGTLRMNRLIDALLNFSRLAHVELRRETVDLSTMAHLVAAELKLAGPGRKVTILIAEGVSADGDAALLRVVLDNLLGNAWKYSATREKAVIEFGATEIDGKPAYFVRDNGTGFDNADVDKIFTPFQRLSGSEECQGFGIGLATVARIIGRHGGKVWAEGEFGKGATFYFTLSA